MTHASHKSTAFLFLIFLKNKDDEVFKQAAPDT